MSVPLDRRMNVLLATAVVALAASGSPPSRLVEVTGPTLVAFAPPITEKQLDADPNLGDVLDDFQVFLARARPKLEQAGVRVIVLTTRSFRVRSANKTSTYRPGRVDIGYYFVRPGRKPRIVLGVADDEELLNTAKQYFNLVEEHPGKP